MIVDTFSPSRWIPDGVLMASVKEHRMVMGEVPRFKLLRQLVKAKVKTTYPKNWRFK